MNKTTSHNRVRQLVTAAVIAAVYCVVALALAPLSFGQIQVRVAEALTILRMGAVGEALEHFNACPLCGRLVCDHCFIICDDLDMCRSCTNYMQEKGEPVALEQPLKEVQYG